MHIGRTSTDKNNSFVSLFPDEKMDPPFNKNFWNSTSRLHQSPIVREIPVRFVGSEQRGDRSGSAVKIQKVFRGFLVRNSVKKIVEIRSQVEEVEKRISEKQTVDLIKRDANELLRINEMLMSLLFRLDSVRGVDSGVRDCRKVVIKKVISLQEFVDAIVSGNADVEFGRADQIIEAVDETVMECAKHDENIDVSLKDSAETVNNELNKQVFGNQSDDVDQEVVENCELKKSISDCLKDSIETNQTESQSDSSANPERVVGACGEDVTSPSKDENDAVETHGAEDREVKANGKENRTGEENGTNRELLARMVEDNKKMMALITQLFERNEMQTKLLNSLSQRVEQLEKAFVSDRLRRKKKRNSGTIGSCETTPDNKKCGKR